MTPAAADRELSRDVRRRALVVAVPEGVLYAGMVGLAETWFVADATRLGATAFEQGLVVGLPLFVGALGPLLVLRLLARGFSRKALAVGFVIAQSATLVAVALLDGFQQQTPTRLVLGSCLYQVCGQGSSPAWASWYGDLVPDRMRGSYFARRTKAVQYAICVAMVLAGTTLQMVEPYTFLGGGTNAWWPAVARPGLGFALIFGAAAVSRALSAVLLALTPEPRFRGIATTTKILQFLRTGRGSNAWRLVGGSAGFYFVVYLASPFFVPFMVEELKFPYLWVMAALALQVALKAFLQSRFGTAIDRHGARPVWLLAALLCAIVPAPFIWATALPPIGATDAAAIPWGGFWVLLSQGFSGIAWGCFEIALFVLVLDATFRATRPHVIAAQSVMNGLGQLGGSLLGGLFLACSNREFRMLFVVSLGLRLVMAALLPKFLHARRDRPSTGAKALLLRVIGLSPSGDLSAPYAPLPTPAASSPLPLDPAPPPPTAERPGAAPPTGNPRHELIAAVLWWLAIATGVAAAAVWLAPPRGAVADHGHGPQEPETEGGHGGAGAAGVTVGGVPIETYIASPPIPGRPTKPEIDAAIRRGTDAFLQLYVEPSLARAEPGGYLDYTDAAGKTTRLGPDVYVQCHLYLIVHLLMWQEEFGLPKDHPIVQRSLRFLLTTFDEKAGRWLWSEEGCLHAKCLYVLARFGELEKFEQGWRWALASPMYLKKEGLFTMMQSGNIVQSLGPATRSLSGEMGWEHGAPLIDEENTAKFIAALLVAGRSPDDPEVAGLTERLSDYLAQNPLAIGFMKTKDLVGRSWPISIHTKWRLPATDGYRMALAQMRAACRGEWRLNFMLRIMTMFRADLVRALLEAGDQSDELDAIVNGIVRSQEPDGAWRLPHILPLWSMDRPPSQGYKFGNADGANTYSIVLALVAWRRAIYETD